MKTELIFIRHGSTTSNSDGVLHGRTDIPLAPLGLGQARRTAQRIASMGHVESMYSSPLQRALSTAREISQVTGVEPVLEPKLSEFDFGDLEGHTFDDLQVKHPELYLSLIDPNGFDQPFPNGESRSELYERVVGALEDITVNHREARVVVVAHLIVIATAIAHLTTGDPHDVVRYLVRNCSISHLELNGNRSADIHAIDDVSHLDETMSGTR